MVNEGEEEIIAPNDDSQPISTTSIPATTTTDQPPTPRPNTPPHRKLPARKPIRSILKPSPQPQPKFNFKRDILSPFSNKLGYAALEESPLGAVVGAGGSSVGQGVQAAAGWMGNAWKRLGAATATTATIPAEKLKPVEDENQQQQQQQPSSHLIQNYPTEPSSDQTLSSPTSSAYQVLSPNSKFNHLAITSSTEPSHNLNQTNALAPPLHPPPQAGTNLQLSVSSLKKVHFIMSDLKIIYPISNTQPPSFDQLNRLRINQARKLLLANRNSAHHHPSLPTTSQNDSTGPPTSVNGWTARSLELFYDECCRTREEGWGIMRVREIIKQSTPLPPKTLDLTGIPLNRVGAAEVLGDLLSVDFGLKSLVLSGCSLEDHCLKPILHGLLVSGSLPSINFANNPKLRAKGWKLIAVFVKKAKALRNIDLSDNSLDRRSVEYLVQALAGNIRKDHPDVTISHTNSKPSDEPLITNPALTQTTPDPHFLSGLTGSSSPTPSPLSFNGPDLTTPLIRDEDERSSLFPSAPLLREDHSAALQALSAISNWSSSDSSNLISLRLDRCNLKNNQLDTLAHGIRLSKLKHVSLRNNRIFNLGAVSLAVMIKDWPTQTESTFNDGMGGKVDSTPDHNTDQPLRPSHETSDLSTPQVPAPFVSLNSVTARQSDLLAHRQMQGKPSLPQQVGEPSSDEQSLQRAEDLSQSELVQRDANKNISELVKDEMKKAHEQRFRIKSKIDQLPTVGQLLTLDVKSNDLRSGDVFYLAQVLKKNRTLKVLNLAENRIDSAGLVHLADSLRYNTCLETLDLSRNPCCGPNLEGILALRTTCTINNSLKRIFLSQTDLSSQGSIAIAEFLPEMNNLIHLDLTENHGIDIAGVMALAVSAKMNTSLRCLDINIPPNDPDFAHLSQEILQSCVRNTELAQQIANQRGTQTTIAQPMLKSTVVKALANQQQQHQHQNSNTTESGGVKPQSSSPTSGKPQKSSSEISRTQTIKKILASTEETCKVLRDLIVEDEHRKTRMLQEERRVPMIVECSDLVKELIDQVKAGQFQINEALGSLMMDEILRSHAQSVHAQCTAVCEYADAVHNEPATIDTSLISASPRGPSHSAAASSPVLNVFRPSASQNIGLEAENQDSELEDEDESTPLQSASTPKTGGIPSASTGSQPRSGPDGQSSQNLESATSDPQIERSSSPVYGSPNSDKDGDRLRAEATIENGQDNKDRARLDSPSSANGPPRSPVERHSRSLTIEEGEVFRKGSVLGTVTRDDDEEVPGEVLKESILVAQVERTRRNSANVEDQMDTTSLAEEQDPHSEEQLDPEEEEEDDGDRNETDEQGELSGKPMNEILDQHLS
ncbi:hypothetical protein H4Q26_001569 [Puccinia striiformis f. sp. tritici PST-130]|uniref:GAT domain-containing protein n=2 Tax=Puccinia striiformis f. sp. tritici TaxID=168172 RepID=A0A0L0V7J3_9BASI|nr:hypothetical protein H4Q26_001569 [Puccinia striiformis f. sp. tritici PST-130]KNE95247.1 hypothetical protein PSTG_11418 [Puccinia striiformis f. sp. tritici PST-78]